MKAGGRVVFYPDELLVLPHTICMNNCCCRGCEFKAGLAAGKDDGYTVPETIKFEGPGMDTVKYGEK